MTIDWEPLWQAIQKHQRFVLTSHVRPDADALGSELALASAIEALGTEENPKTVQIVNPSASPPNLDFLVPEGRVFKIGEGPDEKEIIATDVHIVLDTSAWSQLQDVGKCFRRSKGERFVIDHHAEPDDLPGTLLHDDSCEATGTLIFRFLKEYDLPITQQMAVWLFAAIATDTGWFRFPSTNSGTYRAIADLIDSGATPSEIYQDLYEQRSPERVRLAAQVLSGLQLESDGELGFLTVAWSDFEQTGARPVDTEDLVNEVLKISGVRCAFIAVEQQNRQIKFSLRAREGVNVAVVAESFGGGGHVLAAGTVLPGPLPEAVEKVRVAMTNALQDGASSPS